MSTPSCRPASSRACLEVSYTTSSVALITELRIRLGRYLQRHPSG